MVEVHFADYTEGESPMTIKLLGQCISGCKVCLKPCADKDLSFPFWDIKMKGLCKLINSHGVPELQKCNLKLKSSVFSYEPFTVFFFVFNCAIFTILKI